MNKEGFMKIKKMLSIIAMVSLIVPLASWAANKVDDPIDIRLEKCIAEDSTTAGMAKCYSKAKDNWDKELNLAYGQLMEKLDSKGKTALRKAQKQWIIFRDGHFEFIHAYYDNLVGTMYIPMRVGDKTGLIKERTLELRSYLKIMEMK